MKSLADKLVPESVKKLIPYQSARRIARNMNSEGHLWLNANELESCCQYGDISQGRNDHYNRYPDFLPFDIASSYQDYCQLHHIESKNKLSESAELIAVRGADEAIDLLVRTFCQPGNDQILVCPPTYGMYEFCADSFSVKTAIVPLLDNFQLDLANIDAQLEDTSIVFLCSPNNPTGNVIHQQDLVTLLEASKDKSLVVVDEAYIEFAPHTSALHLMNDYPHLIVIRTLSKAFGLAAIRVGFLIADASVMTYVSRLIAPYPIADPSAEIALKALSEAGIKQMQQQTQELIEIRNWFTAQVATLAIVDTVYESNTNFVLIRFKGDHNLYDYLLNKGIVARSPANESSVKGCVRISIGAKASMEETLEALKSFQ
ncbi:histidinol-phosphate transaminase [Vibrio rumoiensis]|uniref:histidinol-phosphate transaminase n=1 Tax=Vibrio rumoiensis 1S-45 TaxID=1188252 RepID=A0A1E5DYG6_9VIBR|nr:histidinol-phosphate transaminase [Vibrio rumoiensis]OEF22659.1 histidinol-phosphate transaminase [Vibrio rumoiensis 1S-45]